MSISHRILQQFRPRRIIGGIVGGPHFPSPDSSPVQSCCRRLRMAPSGRVSGRVRWSRTRAAVRSGRFWGSGAVELEHVSLFGEVVRTLGDVSRQRDPLLQENPLVVAGHLCDRVKHRPRFSKVDSPQARCQGALTRQIRLSGTRAGSPHGGVSHGHGLLLITKSSKSRQDSR
jgi:hypothetical protein